MKKDLNIENIVREYGWQIRYNIAKSQCCALVPFVFEGFSAKETLVFANKEDMKKYIIKIHGNREVLINEK